MPFQILSIPFKSEQAEHLWKEHVPHPLLTFLDSNNHVAFTVTHYHYTGRT